MIQQQDHSTQISTVSRRQRIENAWNARVIDHSGASEVGPWGFSDPQGRGLHVVESEFVAEFLSVDDKWSAVRASPRGFNFAFSNRLR